ncbi:MAG: HAD-IA family hydrolase [Pseudomonadota bacterium]
MSSFGAVIFDCDGVLVDSEALGLDDNIRFLREHQITWSREELLSELIGIREDDLIEKLEHAYRAANAAPLPSNFLRELYDQRSKYFDDLAALPGASDLVRALDIPIAVASSSKTESLTAKLQKTELLDLFAPHVYSADKVARGKPNPDIFLFAAEQLGVAPSACLVIEDSINGVSAARRAGMDVWGFTGGSHVFPGHAEQLLEAGADWIADTMDAAREKLRA